MKQKAVIPAGGSWAEKNIGEFRGSPVKRIGDEWMLITAGDTAADPENWNTMTASWGGLGVLWSRNVAFAFIRPGRHTRLFADANHIFTLSFFDTKYRKALAFCGDKSGRDFDKASETGLNPIVFDLKTAGGAAVVSFAEASEIIVCRKLYTHDFDPAKMLDPSIDRECYPQKDYHRMYVGEALTLLVRE
jgi:flavin reductase (DIM6/NTAB) family NADH-FMN oxidoreductase RutF